MNKKYTTKTAALNAIVADIHLLKSDEAAASMGLIAIYSANEDE